ARRGLSYLRCLPKRLSAGHEVDLRLGQPMSAQDMLCCAIHLFKKVVPLHADGTPIQFDKTGKFVFGKIAEEPTLDLEKDLTALAEHNPTIDVLLFPELTIPPEKRNQLQRLLRQKPWDPQLKQVPPAFVLGGSWHDKLPDGKFVNTAPLFDGNGN